MGSESQEQARRERISQLSPAKQRLLAERLRARRSRSVTAIRQGERHDPLPLSFGQERLWFLQRLEPQSSAYNRRVVLNLRFAVESSIVEWAVNQIVRRHESLRTIFPEANGVAQQVVQAPVDEPLPVQVLPRDSRQRMRPHALRQLVDKLSDVTFDLTKGPLVKRSLIKLSPAHSCLVLVFHHIVFDAWSQQVLLSELRELCDARGKGTSPALPRLPIQYADFACWQRSEPYQRRIGDDLSYWKKRLHLAPATTELPCDWARTAEPSGPAGVVQRVVPDRVQAAVKAFCRSESVTPFMVYLSSLYLLLRRHTGQEQVVVGTPVSGRNAVETERLIGMFINVLPMLTNVTSDISGRELISIVRRQTLEAFEYQQVPFERLVATLGVDRDQLRTPLFQVLFNVRNVPPAKSLGRSDPIRPLSSWEKVSKYDLTVELETHGSASKLVLVYRRDRFEEARIKAYAEQLLLLASQLLESPETPIENYSLTNEAFRVESADPVDTLTVESGGSILEHFDRWTKDTPNAVAVQRGSLEWSYAKLATDSSRMGNAMANAGLKVGDLIGIVGQASPALIAAMLGAMRRGFPILLVDDRLPESRQRVMLAEAAARCVLDLRTRSGPEHPRVLVPDTIPIIHLCSESGRLAAPQTEMASRPTIKPVDPDSAAYVVFTSGSTGKPKGILASHRSLAHFVVWQSKEFGIGPNDRVAQLTNLSFDVAYREIFTPLVSGATCCLPLPSEYNSWKWLASERISVLHLVPSIAKIWMEEDSEGLDLSELRYTFFAGEPLSGDVVRRWLKCCGPTEPQLVNLYGPSETTLAKTFYIIPKHGISDRAQPVGVPLPGVEIKVRDNNGSPCGLYENGEIVIRTPFSLLGYLGKTSPSSRSSFSGPENPAGPVRTFHTGDFGYWNGSRQLIIHGRRDDQIKIRGVRIELAEVVSAIESNKSVKYGCVVVVSTDNREKSLIGYWEPDGHTSLDSAGLRQFLREHMPPEMVPMHLVKVDRLPKLPSGKVDYKKLPTPTPHEERTPSQAPKTATQQRMSDIWAALLQLKRVGIHDDFFELGGHSLSAVVLLDRIEKAFGQKMTLAQFLQHPTVQGVCNTMAQDMSRTEKSSCALVPLQPEGTQPPLFYIHTWGGTVSGFLPLAMELGLDQPFYGVQSRGLVDPQLLDGSVEQMARAYVAEIQSHFPKGPYLLAGASMGGIIAYEMARLLRAKGCRSVFVALVDSSTWRTDTAIEKVGPKAYLKNLLDRGLSHTKKLIKPAGTTRSEYLVQRLKTARRRLLSLLWSWRIKYSSLTGNQLPVKVASVRETNYQSIRSYRVQDYGGDVTLFRAMERPMGRPDTPDNGWGQYVRGELTIRNVPGSHRSVTEPPNRIVLAGEIKMAIAEFLKRNEKSASSKPSQPH